MGLKIWFDVVPMAAIMSSAFLKSCRTTSAFYPKIISGIRHLGAAGTGNMYNVVYLGLFETSSV